MRTGRRPAGDDRFAQVDGFVRTLVRGGLLSLEAMHAEVRSAVADELPAADAGALSAELLSRHRDTLRREQQTWPATTDHDRLQAAFAELESRGVLVLQGCQDHWAAKSALERPGKIPPRGVVWFTMPDVWHAVDEPMLEVNLWHSDTANAAPGDALLDEVLAVLSAHGVAAHFDEGRIEVVARWQRRV